MKETAILDYIGRPHDALTKKMIGAAIEVHRTLGPGLLESVYEACLIYELNQAGLCIECQKALPLHYPLLGALGVLGV